ncbi:MAG: hypothetical protein ACM3NQ_09160 [Bacteroidales bacterium]
MITARDMPRGNSQSLFAIESVATTRGTARRCVRSTLRVVADGGVAATCHPGLRRPQLVQRRNIDPFSHQGE